LASLPVIVSFGGISPAGRSSFHHGYRRMLADVLDTETVKQTYTDLAVLMNLLKYADGTYTDAQGTSVDLDEWLMHHRPHITDHTLVRQLEKNLFDPSAMPLHTASTISPCADSSLRFEMRSRHLPKRIPDSWAVESLDDGTDKVCVTVVGALDVLFKDTRTSMVNSAGQLPSGFEPDKLYASRSHPRGLQLSIYAASDALHAMGIDWGEVMAHVSPDEIGVFASSSMAQLDEHGNGGLLQSHLKGKRVSSKQLALGFAEMPADFVNAYVLGNVGGTGASVGACATFLYNLKLGMEEIRSGRKRVVVVGDSEAAITPEVIDGFRTMGALAEDKELLALDGGNVINHRRACRPFSSNCGFTLAEGAQFVVLFDDALALELGANILGSVGDVFVNADGFKKSISSPGVGNYVTMAKTLASARAIVGDEGLQRSFVQAHGTGTPQNRVTESHILNEMAKTFGINNWPITAVKSYLGHTLAVAAGDQLMSTLGVWKYGIIPAISTIDHIADDVHNSELNILTDNLEVGAEGIDVAILNSKGFGGNNASASILAPHVTRTMLEKKHGTAALVQHSKRNEAVQAKAQQYDEAARKGQTELIYKFGQNVKEGSDVTLSKSELKIDGYQNPISLQLDNPYGDMC
jgi:acetoacetyl-[acyl-carrier protein] synthase